MKKETDRLNEIVTRILTPAKKPTFEYFNLHEALQRVLALSNAESNENLIIERDYDPSIPEIYGDKNLFIQALINITQNAITPAQILLKNLALVFRQKSHIGSQSMVQFIAP